MVNSVWSELPEHYPSLRLDAFVVMPNHIHGILVLADESPDVPQDLPGQAWEPAATPELSTIVHGFKTLTTHRYGAAQSRRGASPVYPRLWQPNYYEHVIRNEVALHDIREYIANNPARWSLDRENPSCAAPLPPHSNPAAPWKV